MGPLMLMAWFSGLLLHLGDDSENEEDLDTPEEPETPEEPDAELDTGASFVRTDDGVELELGDDETGSLAVIYYLDTEDNPDDFIQIDEARFYLVPEGVDWSNASWETRDDVPGQNESEGPRGYDLEDFEEHFGLELLGTVNLKGVPVDEDDPSNRFGGITANAPVEGYYLEAGTDTDTLISFLPEDFVPTLLVFIEN
ncbi:hypothetical protein [Pseudosulfitobacter koreensis]|uniref:Uncharacterized protein n=1 Tax=Pseudosulfitobacter koreensis TaxID=2968472 RepID=A0ABT1Z1Y7_9RHOB|nr:hypothetical protein [Pseudosulfitobacter koreense]MCR8827144.1 hypothetical protein [Pseudosulfitobacter koreense]